MAYCQGCADKEAANAALTKERDEAWSALEATEVHRCNLLEALDTLIEKSPQCNRDNACLSDATDVYVCVCRDMNAIIKKETNNG